MYSVIIHHAVSGCFACRKIICFNLPSFQTHTEHHILCKKVLWVAPSSSPLQQLYCWKGFCVSHILPHQVYTRHPLSEKRFKVFLSQRRGSCYSLFLLISCSHTEILVPSCSHTCSVHHCFLLCCRKGTSRMQTFPFHMNNLVNSPWMALGTGFFCLFVFKSVSTGHSASVVEKNSVLQQHSGSFHH